MHPIIFEFGSVAVYSYGFMIALGALAGVIYMAVQGKKEVGLTFDQANTLFMLIFVAAFAGGKFFLFFEDPEFYYKNPVKLLTGRGFVFYGSFLFAVPVMLWYFRQQKLHTYAMLDVMAVTTCLVHAFGRLGCFLAGCCYGKPTASVMGVTFTNDVCFAKPLHTPLHPTQLYEAFFILAVMSVLLFLRSRRKFYGQLFFIYLLAYASGRFVIEYFRGDLSRGFIIDGYLSNSQLFAIFIFVAVVIFYFRRSRSANAIAG